MFGVGQLIRHRLFNYRGVIIDVDPVYSGSEEWYEQMARTRPPRFKPWYHVLVHDAVHRTYVAERNLEADDGSEPVNHPELDEFFSEFVDGRYKPRLRGN
jgi:heat shock protein HspQ